MFTARFSTIGFCALFLIICTIIVAPVFCQTVQSPSDMVPMKATLVKVGGSVMVQIGTAAVRQAKVNDILNAGDRIETKADGRVEIKADNGNIITLGPDSELILSKMERDPASGNYQNLMESKYGEVRCKVLAKIKDHTKSKFEVKTPNAICGARGTIFYIVTTGAGTRIFVDEGSIGVDNPLGGDTFIVLEDMAALSSPDGMVRELTGEEKDKILEDYKKFLEGEGEGEGEDEGTPSSPSLMTDDPQSITENPPGENKPKRQKYDIGKFNVMN